MLTPTPGAPTETPAPGQPTHTRTPTRTPDAAGTVVPPSPTPTPTPLGPTQLGLRVLSWQWDWCAIDQPCLAGSCPGHTPAWQVENPDPLGRGQNGITLYEGCTYQITIHNTDDPGQQTQPHELDAGLVAIGVPDTIIYPGQVITYTVTIPTSGTADYGFSCKNSSCSGGGPPETTHEKMLGVIHIAP